MVCDNNFTAVPASLSEYRIGDDNELNNLFAVFYEMAEKVELNALLKKVADNQ